ncbi:hypothetical protein FNF28_01076 [Cafeteria roenbergensis]|uniref:Oxidation resistance protein 1 n=1 Tax=Cafeteria roenbergensis TaxID=33653 RepID=A0A5A8E537_CAFRO|nr:hypothetical protein FNF28_01076 [Cafeteria roenbergensis]
MASSHVTKLDPGSDAFKRILYSLQVALRGTNVSNVHAWFVETPSLRAKYERQTSTGGLELPSWVDVDALPAHNPVQEVCARGFRMPEDGGGLSFHSGNIDLSDVGDRTQHQFLLCRIAVGRAFALLEEGAARAVPEGYDSLYVHSADDEADAGDDEAAGASGLHRHEYVLTNPAQALPEYIVHFDFDPADAVMGPPPSATMTLDERRDHFRAKIDEVRGEVSRALSVLGPSLGSRTEEMLADLTTKYESALHASTQPEPLLEERKRSIHEGIRRITGKLEQVRSNSEAVYEEVCKRMQDALERLEALTKHKTAILLSEELELRRQLRQISSAETMVPHLQEALQPTAFVEAWEAHQAMRRELIAQMTGAGASMVGEALDAVRPDLKVVGEVEVVEGSAAGRRGDPAAAAGAGPSGSAVASRLFDGTGSATSSSGAGLAAAAAAASAAGGAPGSSQVPSAWFREEAGMPPAATPAPAPAARPDGRSEPPKSALALLDRITGPSPSRHAMEAELARARAALDLERANLASVQTRVASLPAAHRSIGEEALSQQEERVAAATAAFQEASASYTAAAGGSPGASRAFGESTWGEMSSASPPAPPMASRMAPSALDVPQRQSEPAGRGASSADAAATPATVPASASETPAGSAMAAASSRPRQTRSPAKDPREHMERVLRRNRLSAEAARRHRRIGLSESDLDGLAFSSSKLVEGKVAHDLYACLPFVRPRVDQGAGGYDYGMSLPEPVPPRAQLVFSTLDDAAPSFRSLAACLAAVEGPTLFIFSANDHLFGAYASQTWRFDGEYHGDASSFLFSITRDARVPFVGRISGPPQPSDAALRAAHDHEFQMRKERWIAGVTEARARAEASGVVFDANGSILEAPEHYPTDDLTVPPPRPRPWKRIDTQYSDEGRISFGLTDLVIEGDLARCSSEIESTFGIGLRAGSTAAKTLLAGAETFAVSNLEVWSVGNAAYDSVA